MNRENVRNPARSIANPEFHHTGDEVNDVARRITAALEHAGIRAHESADGVSDGSGSLDDRADLGRWRISRSRSRPGWGTWAFIAT